MFPTPLTRFENNFWQHGGGDFAQRIESFDDRVEHNNEVVPRIEMLHITLSAHLATGFENFSLRQQIYYLSKHRLSAKMCTFAHGYRFLVLQSKDNQKGQNFRNFAFAKCLKTDCGHIKK